VDSGGTGTIEYHPLTLSLVINQTPDIQEQVQELLVALRRLQDQEVAVEVKVVSLSDDFYEIIGVNFSMNIPTNTAGTAAQVANGYRPSTLISGITPAGNLTSDLSIPITNNTFNQAFLPFYGGNPAIPGVGGISMGLAFLSDIQVFLFLEAAQSDRRTNVMQAPKLTLFNGQIATMTVSETAPYVTNVLLQQQNGQTIFVPQVQSLGVNVTITIQAVISADRRFVRLSLNPNFTVPVPGPVALFPIVVPVFPTPGIIGQSPNPIVFTQLIQQPGFNTINVGTTVAVPDGGTVVLGGLKAMAEARTEVGPPVLSKIPYIRRLFQNVAYGRESSSLLIMVTPRIIILEEEEVYQTGFTRPQTQGVQ
jgi:type II secretory pathway component GspD/PulD (secretin)